LLMTRSILKNPVLSTPFFKIFSTGRPELSQKNFKKQGFTNGAK